MGKKELGDAGHTKRRGYRELDARWEEGFLQIDCSKRRIIWRDSDEKVRVIFGMY